MTSNGISSALKRRLTTLDRIYNIYDSFISSYDMACRQFCSACCTCNMTLTTLEGYRLISRMNREEREILYLKVRAFSGSRRFQPRMTINRIAQLCRDGKPVPDENIDPAWGNCLLLENDACRIYLPRPFGCRCMVSKTDCRQTGFANIDELILSVNNVFLQYIEHVDQNGATGNLIDILLYFADAPNLENYRNQTDPLKGSGLAPNRPIPVLMVPPEHRHRVQPILQRLQLLDQT